MGNHLSFKSVEDDQIKSADVGVDSMGSKDGRPCLLIFPIIN